MRDPRAMLRRAAHRLLRLVQYGLSVGLSAVSSAVVIPFVVHEAGAAAWGGIAVGQSVGSILAVFTAFGWGVNGPVLVAQQPDHAGRVALFRRSLVLRALLAVPAVVVTAVVTWAVAPAARGPAAVVGVALTLTALGAGWYFVGESRPLSLVAFDTVPRLAGTLVGVVALVLGGGLLLFATLQLAGTLCAVVLSAVRVLGGSGGRVPRTPRRGWAGVVADLRDQLSGVVTAGTSTLYTYLPVIVVAVVVPSATALYGLVDRLGKFALSALSPVDQAVQGWVPRARPAGLVSRMRQAIAASSAAGLLGGACLVVLGPPIGRLLTGGQIRLGADLTLPAGVAFAAIAMTHCLGLTCLNTLGHTRDVAVSTVSGAALGVPLLFVLAHAWGVTGVAWAVAASELVVLVCQVLLLRVRLAEWRAAVPGPAD